MSRSSITTPTGGVPTMQLKLAQTLQGPATPARTWNALLDVRLHEARTTAEGSTMYPLHCTRCSAGAGDTWRATTPEQQAHQAQAHAFSQPRCRYVAQQPRYRLTTAGYAALAGTEPTGHART